MGNLLAGAQGAMSNAGGVQGLMQNPMFNVGMGLLQSNNANFGEDNNPFRAAMGGLRQTQQQRDLAAEREELKKARERQDELYKKLQELYGNPTGAQPNPMQPQMSPIPPAMQAPNVLGPMGGQQMGIPGQTPGFNPNAPPIGGAPGPFGQALGTSAGGAVSGAPDTSEIAAIMMQYGSPQQQQAVFSSMSAGDRFKAQLAAEETRYKRSQEARNKIGQYNPRDYTTESWGEFINTGDPGKLKRYERVREFDLGGGRSGLYDASTGQTIGETVARGDFEENVTGTASARAQGTAQGTAITAAQQQLAGLQTTEDQLLKMFDNPEFSQAVGPVDAVTGRIGEMFGSDQGVLGGEVQRTANRLVTDAVSSWKGAISERELQFFQDSVPGRGSSPETWRAWYQNEYIPRKRLAERVASGEVFHDDRLAGGSSDKATFTNFLDDETVNLLQKYLQPQQGAQ